MGAEYERRFFRMARIIMKQQARPANRNDFKQFIYNRIVGFQQGMKLGKFPPVHFIQIFIRNGLTGNKVLQMICQFLFFCKSHIAFLL